MTVCIGASVVDDVRHLGSTARRFGLPSARVVEPERAAFPSLIRKFCEGQGASRVLVSHDDNVDHSDSVAHAIVSSVTMDFALSLASNQPCRSRLHRADRCDCVAVVIFKPVAINDNDSFPMLCHGSGEPHIEEEEGKSNKNQESDTISTTVEAQRKRRRKTSSPSQPTISQQLALRRVQIRRVTGMNDVMSYLLLVCGLPVEQHPVGGIFLEGLDCLDGGKTVDVATATLRQTQIVALMVDTAHCLQRLYNGKLPLVLVTLYEGCRHYSNSQRSSPLFVSASSFWSPLQLQVRRSTKGHDSPKSDRSKLRPNGPHDTASVVSSHWLVTTPDIKSTAAIEIWKHWENDESYVVWTSK